MDASQPKKNEQPSLNAYFQDSSDSNIFDQLSQNAPRSDENSQNIAETTFIETKDSDKTVTPPDVDAPVISKIFKAEVEPNAKESEGTFFDMIGNGQTLPPSEIISKTKLIPELPSDGKFSIYSFEPC